MQETQEAQVPSLGQEDPLEEKMVTHSSILAWETPRTEELGGLQSMWLQKSRTRRSNSTTKWQRHARLFAHMWVCLVKQNIFLTLFNKKVKVKLLSHVRLFETPWTVAYQALLSMAFSRQECWSGLLFPPPGIFPTQESNPGLPHCRQMLYRLSHQGSQEIIFRLLIILTQCKCRVNSCVQQIKVLLSGTFWNFFPRSLVEFMNVEPLDTEGCLS